MADLITIRQRVLSYLRPHRRRFIASILAMSAYGATDGAIPYILKRVLDDVFGSQDKQMLSTLVVAIVVFAFVRGILGFFERYLSVTVGLLVIEDMRNDIGRKLLTLGSSFFNRKQTGALISSMTNDTLLVKTALTDSSIGLVKEVVRIVALLGTALWLDPALASISFIVFPLCIIPIIKFGRRVKKLSRTAQDLFGGLTAILHEMIVGHKVVQAFTMENHENQRFRKENRAATRNFEKAAKYDALGGPTNEVLASLAIAGIILYGGHSVISGVRTQGDFIAFITAMFLLYEPLKRLGRLNNSIQTGFAAAERIFEVIDETPDIVDCENAIELDAARPRIEFKDVWFSYDPLRSDKTEFALKDVSLKIEPGQTIALVGMSGGGKSTLVNLLPRFYDPTKGSVSINGIDIKQLSLASLRKNIAIVSQHTFLFNDSVAHNIGYGRFQATRDEVIAAAKAANAHDFIIKLPNGYDTFVGEQGLSLSGGERARIAIARALLKNAPILILDEATASLDSESEELVQIAIDRLMNGRTVLVIAHRLATVRGADKILALSNGRIVESGNHQQLLASDGEYAKLYRIQFGAKSEHDKLIAQG